MPPRKSKPARKPAAPAKRKSRPTAAKKAAARKGFASPAWERMALLAVELDALAAEAGLNAAVRDPEGFDLADAARELARLAANHDRAANPDGRTAAQEKDDWVAVGGLGADLGNMADEPTYARVAEPVRAVAYEVCYRACDYLF